MTNKLFTDCRLKLVSTVFAFIVSTPVIIFTPHWSWSETSEIHNCDGRWSNLRCDDKGSTPVKVGTEKASAERKVLSPEQAKARSQKESALHDLRMKNIESKRKLNAEVDLITAEELCEKVTVTLSECEKEIDRLEEKLDKRINANALLKDRNLKERTTVKNSQTDSGPTTVIIKERIPVYVGPHRPYYGNNYSSGNYRSSDANDFGPHGETNVTVQQNNTTTVPPRATVTPPQSSGSSHPIIIR